MKWGLRHRYQKQRGHLWISKILKNIFETGAGLLRRKMQGGFLVHPTTLHVCFCSISRCFLFCSSNSSTSSSSSSSSSSSRSSSSSTTTTTTTTTSTNSTTTTTTTTTTTAAATTSTTTTTKKQTHDWKNKRAIVFGGPNFLTPTPAIFGVTPYRNRGHEPLGLEKTLPEMKRKGSLRFSTMRALGSPRLCQS